MYKTALCKGVKPTASRERTSQCLSSPINRIKSVKDDDDDDDDGDGDDDDVYKDDDDERKVSEGDDFEN